MSTTALYYPNVTVLAPRLAGQNQTANHTDLKLLTTAVLLWDSLEVIVPVPGFGVNPIIGENQKELEKPIREAFELVIKPRAPSDPEKDLVHARLEKLIAKGVPKTLLFESRVDNFNMYPDKLSPPSWKLLRDSGLANDSGHGYHGLRRDAGLIVMGMIADVCAGGTRSKVTNYTDAQEAFCRLIAVQNGAEQDFQPDVQGAYTNLVSLSVRSVDAGKFPLDRLVALRQREKEDGLLPPLRKNYRAAIDRCVERIKTEAKSKADVELIEKEFEQDIRDDFRHLQEMMRLEFGDTIIEKGKAILTAVLKQDWAEAIGPFLNLPSFKLKKQEMLEAHQSSWLYAV
jgi:hypothetical protein